MLKKLEEIFIKFNQILVGSMLFTMFLLVIGNVITRYVFNFSLNWAEELARYLMIWTAFTGIGLAMREHRHVAIELVQDLLPKNIVLIIRILNGLLLLGFMGFLAYLGYHYAMTNMDQSTAVLQWTLGAVYLVIPISAMFFILHMITIFGDYVKKPEMALDDTTSK